MTALPVSVPHAGAVELHCWTLDDFRGLRTLRAVLREVLAEGGVAGRGDGVERVAVVATELATNALRHGLPPAVVSLMRAGDRLVVDVADRRVDAEPGFDPGRAPGRGGLGLVVAQTFASEVGWYRAGEAKHVWACFPV